MKIGNCPSTSLSYSQQKNITNVAAVYCGDNITLFESSKTIHVTSSVISVASLAPVMYSSKMTLSSPQSSPVVYSSFQTFSSSRDVSSHQQYLNNSIMPSSPLTAESFQSFFNAFVIGIFLGGAVLGSLFILCFIILLRCENFILYWKTINSFIFRYLYKLKTRTQDKDDIEKKSIDDVCKCEEVKHQQLGSLEEHYQKELTQKPSMSCTLELL